MGYYTAQHLPVYDYLARNFCVCDAWHSSIPGDTWPNRLYSLAGRQGQKIGYKPNSASRLLARLKGLPALVGCATPRSTTSPPSLASSGIVSGAGIRTTRRRCAPPTASTVDSADLNRENFTYFDRSGWPAHRGGLRRRSSTHDSFLDDAAKGELRDVSWIDPNFVDLQVLHPNSNDDHPPVRRQGRPGAGARPLRGAGQQPGWEDTLLVVVYDEHGGFYDHVAAADGRRRPAPATRPSAYGFPLWWSARGSKHVVCHQTFEHTSLIATILRRFAADPERALAGCRTGSGAPHLGAA